MCIYIYVLYIYTYIHIYIHILYTESPNCASVHVPYSFTESLEDAAAVENVS